MRSVKSVGVYLYCVPENVCIRCCLMCTCIERLTETSVQNDVIRPLCNNPITSDTSRPCNAISVSMCHTYVYILTVDSSRISCTHSFVPLLLFRFFVRQTMAHNYAIIGPAMQSLTIEARRVFVSGRTR